MRIGVFILAVFLLAILSPVSSYCQFSDEKILSDPFAQENQDPFGKASPFGGKSEKYGRDEFQYYMDTAIISTPIYDYGRINAFSSPSGQDLPPSPDTPIDDWLIYLIPLVVLIKFKDLFFKNSIYPIFFKSKNS